MVGVPTQYELTLPLLKLCSDNKEHTLTEANSILAKQLKLKEEDVEDRLDSGERRLSNYIRWAAWHLKKAGLLKATGVGKFRITPSGLQILESKPAIIDSQFLQGIRHYRESVRAKTEPDENGVVVKLGQTPEAIIENAHKEHESALADELLETILSCSPRFFEHLVIDLLVKMGYGGSRKDAAQSLGKVNDEGIDGMIKEDELGLTSIYIQAKRWKSRTVGRPDVQAFVGSLDGKRSKKGIFITTSDFASTAREYVKNTEKNIVLINGTELARLMIKYGVGVSTVGTYSVKRLDNDYFVES